MDLSKVFVQNMKKYRKMTGISQEKLAQLCGVSHSHIRQIECGSRGPSFALIDKAATALQIPPSLLFSDEAGERDYQRQRAQIAEAELIENIRATFAKL
jgi:transcriptional regulator with XRE-family HTH domain